MTQQIPQSSVAQKSTLVTSNYTALMSDSIILVDATAGEITITLPAAAVATGLTFIIKKIDASSNFVRTSSAELIDGEANVDVTEQYGTTVVASSGTTYLATGGASAPAASGGGSGSGGSTAGGTPLLRFKAEHNPSAPQTFSNNNPTRMQFTNIIEDTEGLWSSVAPNDYPVPRAGRYLVICKSLVNSSNPVGYTRLSVAVNQVIDNNVYANVGNLLSGNEHVSVLKLDAGDRISMQFLHTNGGSLTQNGFATTNILEIVEMAQTSGGGAAAAADTIAFRAYQTNTQSFQSNAVVKVQFDTVDAGEDPNGVFDIVDGDFNVPVGGAGRYFLNAHILLNMSTGGQRGAGFFYVNNQRITSNYQSIASSFGGVSCSSLITLEEGDVVDYRAFHTESSSRTTFVSPGPEIYNYFEGFKVV